MFNEINQNMQRLLLFLSLNIVAAACKHGKNRGSDNTEWSEMPAVIRIDSMHNTEFVPTLENPVDPKKNTIYAAALLYAWDSITKLLPGNIINDDRYSNDFNLLRRSTSFQNSLRKDEYKISAGIEGDLIVVEAFFNKTLPFPAKMEKSAEPMLFDGQKVRSFGMYKINENIVGFSQILYYADDEHFMLKLSPKETEHELLLMKSPNTFVTLADAVQKAKEWNQVGEKEMVDDIHTGKYSFANDDIISIPEIKFNIDAFFKKLEGRVFFARGKEKTIATAYQRTGFILSETGAVAESHTVMLLDSAAPLRKVEPRIKKLVLDKPFYVILKRTGDNNPYFVMRVANTELLVKQ